MGINELFEGIAKVVERFTEELAEQKLQEKEQKTGRDPKERSEKTEKNVVAEKRRKFPETGVIVERLAERPNLRKQLICKKKQTDSVCRTRQQDRFV